MPSGWLPPDASVTGAPASTPPDEEPLAPPEEEDDEAPPDEEEEEEAPPEEEEDTPPPDEELDASRGGVASTGAPPSGVDRVRSSAPRMALHAARARATAAACGVE